MRFYDVGAQEGPEVVRDRVLTVPNVLSLARLAILPVVYVMLTGDEASRLKVFWLLVVFGWTDWFDGYIARRFNQVSRLGKLLDPISDRALFVVVGVAMIVADIVPVWVVALLLARDVPVIVGGLVLLGRGLAPPAVTKLGKTATFLLMWAFPAFILADALGDGAGGDHGAWLLFAWAMYVPGVAAYFASAGQYLLAVRGPGGAEDEPSPTASAGE